MVNIRLDWSGHANMVGMMTPVKSYQQARGASLEHLHGALPKKHYALVGRLVKHCEHHLRWHPRWRPWANVSTKH